MVLMTEVELSSSASVEAVIVSVVLLFSSVVLLTVTVFLSSEVEGVVLSSFSASVVDTYPLSPEEEVSDISTDSIIVEVVDSSVSVLVSVVKFPCWLEVVVSTSSFSAASVTSPVSFEAIVVVSSTLEAAEMFTSNLLVVSTIFTSPASVVVAAVSQRC